jgi:hypothetical protein
MWRGRGARSVEHILVSFRRIVDIPFDECVAALASWLRRAGELHAGPIRLRGPMEHDPDSGTYLIDARLARGRLRAPLRMRLEVDAWSSSASTALDLIPCERVRTAPAYYRAGHLALTALTRSLQLEVGALGSYSHA